MEQNGKGVMMIGVSLSHGQETWMSQQKKTPWTLIIVLLQTHVGPQQQHAAGVKAPRQHLTCTHCEHGRV
jgi:hypothetical protein